MELEYAVAACGSRLSFPLLSPLPPLRAISFNAQITVDPRDDQHACVVALMFGPLAGNSFSLLSLHLSTSPPLHLSTSPPLHLLTSPPLHLSTSPPLPLSTSPPLHLSTSPPLHLSTSPLPSPLSFPSLHLPFPP